MWYSSCPLRSSQPAGGLLNIIPVPCDECHDCLGMGTQNPWGRNSQGGDEAGMLQVPEVTFAKAKPEETCSFKNRSVPGGQDERPEG